MRIRVAAAGGFARRLADNVVGVGVEGSTGHSGVVADSTAVAAGSAVAGELVGMRQ